MPAVCRCARWALPFSPFIAVAQMLLACSSVSWPAIPNAMAASTRTTHEFGDFAGYFVDAYWCSPGRQRRDRRIVVFYVDALFGFHHPTGWRTGALPSSGSDTCIINLAAFVRWRGSERHRPSSSSHSCS